MSIVPCFSGEVGLDIPNVPCILLSSALDASISLLSDDSLDKCGAGVAAGVGGFSGCQVEGSALLSVY